MQRLKALKSHQGFMKYFKNTSWLFAEKILRMVVGFFVGIWVVRYLGPEQFGLFSYVQSFVGIVAPLAALGLNNIIIRNLVQTKDNKKTLLFTGFILKILGSFLVLILILLGMQYSDNSFNENTLIFIIAISIFFQSFSVIDLYFQSIVQSKYVVYVTSISLFLSSMIKVLFIVNGASLVFFAYLILFDSFVVSVGLFYFLYKQEKFKIGSFRFSKELAVSLLKESWPLILSGIAISIYAKTDQLMIKWLLGNEEVGQYAAAVKLSEAWFFILSSIIMSLYPVFIKAKSISEQEYLLKLSIYFKYMIWINIFVSIIVTYMSEDMISTLYGTKFNETAHVLVIYIWSSIFVFLGGVVHQYLVIEQVTKIQLYRTLYGVFMNIALNIILIPIYGIQGAAMATIISYSVVAFFSLFTFNSTRRIGILIVKSFFWRTNEFDR